MENPNNISFLKDFNNKISISIKDLDIFLNQYLDRTQRPRSCENREIPIYMYEGYMKLQESEMWIKRCVETMELLNKKFEEELK